MWAADKIAREISAEQDPVLFPEYLITSLTQAIKEQNLSEVKSLLNKDERLLDKIYPQDYTIWHLACMEGSPEILDEILSRLQDIHIALILDTKEPDNFKPTYANLLLEQSLSELNFKKADLLFKLGAELDQIDEDKNTLLHRLIIQGKTDAITWLLDKDPDLEQTNNEGNTALQLAAELGYKEMILSFYAKRKLEQERQELPNKINKLVSKIKLKYLIKVLDLALEDEPKAREMIKEDLYLPKLFAGCEVTDHAQKALTIFYPIYKNYLNQKLLDRERNACILTLEGHTSLVACIAIMQDGTIVSGSKDKSLKIWDKESKCLHNLEVVHELWVTCVAVMQDGNIVSGSHDGTLKIWDIECLGLNEQAVKDLEQKAEACKIM